MPSEEFIGQLVVVELSAPFIALGTLRAAGEAYYEIEDANLHDLRESGCTRDYFLHERREAGVQPNRRSLLLPREAVVAICRFEDLML